MQHHTFELYAAAFASLSLRESHSACRRVLLSSGVRLVVFVRVTLGMQMGVAELTELLRRVASHARRALRSHEDMLRLLRHVQPLANGDVARQLVPMVKACVSIKLDRHLAG